ncbi:MAG: ribulose-phosphate 3-epimerase [Anaerolineaceae bacterium]|nr:ribulose-phosphate 3-epimerase [Anaerolineaceae bacterium]
MLISASILSADFTNLKEQIQLAEQAGVDWIHIDVIDGHFAPNITMGPFIVEACKRVTNLPLDVHLMIEQPDRYAKNFVDAGADYLTVHTEADHNLAETLKAIRSYGARPGIVIKPATPASDIEPFVSLFDMILIMTVNPGFSGQGFMSEVVPKITEVQHILQAHHSDALIEVDGGITSQTLPTTYDAGARVFVAATAIFKHPGGIAAGVQELRQSVGA